MVTQAQSAPGSAEAPAVNPETAVAPSGAPESMSGQLPRDVDLMVEEFIAATDPAKQLQEAPAPEKAKQDDDDESNADDYTEDDPALEPEKPLAKNWRVTAKSEAEAKALDMYRRNPALTLEECLARVNGKTSPAADPSAPAVPKTETPAPQESSAVPAVAEIEALIEAKKAERKQLRADFDYEKADEVSDEMEALKDQLRDARAAEKESARSSESAAKQEFTQQVEAAEARTITLYPDAAVEGSELWNAMIDIQERLHEAGDTDTLNAPDVSLRIARMAARELNVAPAGKNQRSAATIPEQGPAPNPVKPRPVPGRGAAPTSAAPQIDLKRLTLEQLDELAASFK